MVASRVAQLRTWRSRRFWKRSTWPAVSMIVCLPVKNGWQLPHTSTRSSGPGRADRPLGAARAAVDLGFVILGMDIGLHVMLSSDAVRAGRWPSRWSPVYPGLSTALAAAVSTASTRMRFLVLVACSNFTLPVDRREHGVVVAQPGAGTGQERHAALADDDRAGADELAVAGLDAEPLADAVAAVLDAAAGLLVCHLVYSSFFVVRVRFGASALALGVRRRPWRSCGFGASTSWPGSSRRSAFGFALGVGVCRRLGLGRGLGLGLGRRAFGAALAGRRLLRPPSRRPTASFAASSASLAAWRGGGLLEALALGLGVVLGLAGVLGGALAAERMSVMRRTVSSWRWPFLTRLRALGRYLNEMSLSPAVWRDDLGADRRRRRPAAGRSTTRRRRRRGGRGRS